MMGFMRQHQARVRAEAAKQSGGTSPRPAGGTVIAAMPGVGGGKVGAQQLAALVTASLGQDLAALKDMASVERKAEYKRSVLIPKYRDQVDRLMADGKAHDAIAYYLVWLLDAGCVEQALHVAAWAMAHGQALPETFKSRLPFFVASQVLEWAEGEYNAGRAFEPYLSQILTLMEADPAAWDIPDAVKARYYRLPGLAAEKAGDLRSAAIFLERALTLGASVKTALDNVKKRLAKQETESKQDACEPRSGVSEASDSPSLTGREGGLHCENPTAGQDIKPQNEGGMDASDPAPQDEGGDPA